MSIHRALPHLFRHDAPANDREDPSKSVASRDDAPLYGLAAAVRALYQTSLNLPSSSDEQAK